MYHSISEVIFLAQHHHFRFIPAAGPYWQGNYIKGKQPLISFHEASGDIAQLETWAKQYHDCNWYYVPGDTQAVLDVDVKHDGMALLRSLEETHGALPRTPRVRTGGMGSHFHFSVPPGLSVKKNIAGNEGLTFACGGKLGFIVPPCVHANGKQYAWELAPWDCPIAPAPEWLLALASDPEPPKATASAPTPVASFDPMTMTMTMGGGDGLREHAGASEGNRHNTLLQLLGRELGRGRTIDAIEPELLAWADRCSPPMPHSNAIRHLRGLSKKHKQQTKHGKDESHNTVRVRAVRSVEDATDSAERTAHTHSTAHTSACAHPETAESERTAHTHSTHAQHGACVFSESLPGIAGDFAKAIAPELEGDVIPVVFCLLSAFGSCVGPKPHVRVSGERHGANIFASLVAPSGGSKSEPWAWVSLLMQKASPNWFADCVGYGLGSGEGLIERLGDDASEKRFYGIEAEFGGVIIRARRDGSTLTPTLCNAWDGRTMEVANRKEAKLRSSGHHVSLWANITDAELAKRIGGSLEAVNGFANRFLWLKQTRKRFLPFGGNVSVIEPFVSRLADAIAKARTIGEVHWSEEAKLLWAEAYPALCRSQEAMPCLGRARSQALRLTLLFALLDGSETIEPLHVNAGLSLWQWAEASAKSIFGSEPPSPSKPATGLLTMTMGVDESTHAQHTRTHTPLAVRVRERIERESGITRTALARALHAKADALNAALAELEASGEAERTREGQGERWRLAEQQKKKQMGKEAESVGRACVGVPLSPLPSDGEAENTQHTHAHGACVCALCVPVPGEAHTPDAQGGACVCACACVRSEETPPSPPSLNNASLPETHAQHTHNAQEGACAVRVRACVPSRELDDSAWAEEFIAQLEAFDMNAPEWDSEAWLADFRAGTLSA